MFFPLLLQSVAIVVIGVLVWLWSDKLAAMALLYGGGVSVANSGLLVLRWRNGLKDYHCDGARHLKMFHRSVMERFFVVCMLLATGFGMLSLKPLVMLLGFVVGQVLWVLAMLLSRRLS